MDMFVHCYPWAHASRCRVQGAIEGTSVIPENLQISKDDVWVKFAITGLENIGVFDK